VEEEEDPEIIIRRPTNLQVNLARLPILQQEETLRRIILKKPRSRSLEEDQLIENCKIIIRGLSVDTNVPQMIDKLWEKSKKMFCLGEGECTDITDCECKNNFLVAAKIVKVKNGTSVTENRGEILLPNMAERDHIFNQLISVLKRERQTWRVYKGKPYAERKAAREEKERLETTPTSRVALSHSINYAFPKVALWNAQSINSSSKKGELIEWLQENSVDILGVTETWLKSENNTFRIPGYQFIGKNRANSKISKNKPSGGVGWLVKESSKIHVRKVDSKFTWEDVMWVEMTFSNSMRPKATWVKARVALVYLPSSSPYFTDKQTRLAKFYAKLVEEIKFHQGNCSNVWILGDFNARFLAADSANLPIPMNSLSDYQNPSGKLLVDMVEQCNLWILNGRNENNGKNATHYWETDRSTGQSMLDLIMVSQPNQVYFQNTQACADDDMGSDHVPVITQFQKESLSIESTKEFRGWKTNKLKKTEGKEMWRLATSNAFKVLSQMEPEDSESTWNNFSQQLTEVANEELGRKVVSNDTFRPVPWFDVELREAVHKRQKLARQWRNSGGSNLDLLFQLKMQKKWIKKLTKTKQNENWTNFQKEICNDLKQSPFEGWRKVRTLLKWRKNNLGPIRNEEGELVEGGSEYLETWRNYFDKLGNSTPNEELFDKEWRDQIENEITQADENLNYLVDEIESESESNDDSSSETNTSDSETYEIESGENSEEESESDTEIEVLRDETTATNFTNEIIPLNGEIRTREIQRALAQMANNKAPGDDKVTSEMLKSFGSNAILMLKNFFQVILDSGVVPDDWHSANIIPLFKKGDATCPTNYRGISLNNVVGKVFGRVLANRIAKHMEGNGLFSESQFGFREHRSTTDALAIVHILSHEKAKSKNLYMFFMDIVKAYDRVWQNGLWWKLIQVGIDGKIRKVLQNLYSKVSYKVLTRQGKSEAFDVSLGLKQGCVLSPILFNIFINDLSAAIDQGGVSCKFRGVGLSHILFADDGLILANDATDLRNKLKNLEKWLKKWRLEIGHEKCGILKLGEIPWAGTPVIVQGKEIPIVESYRYLGCDLTQKEGKGCWEVAIKSRLEKLKTANQKLIPFLRATHINPATKVYVWKAVAQRAALYGVEFGKLSKKMIESFEVEERKALKWILSCRRSALSAAVYSDLGVLPFRFEVLASRIRLLRRMNRTPSVILQNLVEKTKNTEGSLYKDILSQIDEDFDLENEDKEEFDSNLAKMLKRKATQWLEDENSEKPSWSWYDKVRKGSHFKVASYMAGSQSTLATRVFFNLRSKSMALRGRTSDWGEGIMRSGNIWSPPSNKVCQSCQTGEIESHAHFLYDCPALKKQRSAILRGVMSLVEPKAGCSADWSADETIGEIDPRSTDAIDSDLALFENPRETLRWALSAGDSLSVVFKRCGSEVNSVIQAKLIRLLTAMWGRRNFLAYGADAARVEGPPD
jgi:exonuclease III